MRLLLANTDEQEGRQYIKRTIDRRELLYTHIRNSGLVAGEAARGVNERNERCLRSNFLLQRVAEASMVEQNRQVDADVPTTHVTNCAPTYRMESTMRARGMKGE